MTDNSKFIPNLPKTYEVRYVERQEPSKLIKIASYLGLSVAECCGTCGVSDKKFELDLNLRNAAGGHLTGSAYNTSQAKSESTAILSGTGSWSGGPLRGGCYRKKNREALVDKVNDAINEHTSDGGKAVIRTLYAG